MKKYLSLLAAVALILTAAGCGNTTEAETTTAAETTAEETTVDTDEAADDVTEVVDEDYTVEAETDEALIIDDAYLNTLAEKAPLYAEYARVSGTIPYTAELIVLDEDGNEIMGTTTSIASLDKIAMVISQSGAATRIVMADYCYYMISDDTKECLYQTLDEETWNQTLSSAFSEQNYLNLDALEVVTGEEELFGTTYTVEDVKDDTMGVKCYFDSETGKVVYISSSYDYEGETVTQTIKVGEYYNGIDESLFELPEDYTYTDMSELGQ